MSKVDVEIVVRFIQKYALKGPEKLSKDGQFDDFLMHKADVVSDIDDTNICPDFLNGMK